MKRILLLLILGTIFTGCTTTSPGVQNMETDKRTSQTVDGIMVPTLDYTILERWNNTLPVYEPEITKTTRAFKGQSVYFPILFNSYGIGENNEVHLTININIMNADGTILFMDKDIEGVNTVTLDSQSVLLSGQFTGIQFEETDPFGYYTVNAEIVDHIGRTSKKLVASIELVPREVGNYFNTFDDVNDWISSHHTTFNPEKAIEAFEAFVKLDLSGDVFLYASTYSFFIELFTRFPFLTPGLIELYKEAEFNEKAKVLILLNHINNPEVLDFMATLKGQDIYEKFKLVRLLPLSEPLREAYEVDVLWGQFMAGGSVEPLFKIVQSLGLASKNQLVYKSVDWSLRVHGKKHELVREYLKYIYAARLIEEDLLILLGDILKDILAESGI